jgi:hypothetical protein
LPLDFLVLVHFFHRFQSYFWAAWQPPGCRL